MSNHITCSENQLIKLKYANGIETYVACGENNADYVKGQVCNAIERYKKYIIDKQKNRKKLIEKFGEDFVNALENDNMGVVWHIDSYLNDCNTAQFSMNNLVGEIEIGFDYDLGENEDESIIEKLRGNENI